MAMTFSLANLSSVVSDDKEDDMSPKADVVIKNDETSGKAKAGDLVEVQIRYPIAPPFPDEFEVTVDGKKVDSDVSSGVETKNGKPLVGVGLALIQFKAEGSGKEKVVVSYLKGKETIKKEIELEVTK
jgi:hypothetical protein